MVKNTQELFVVDKTIRIEAPQEAIFRLLTEADQVRRWMPMVEYNARVGSAYRFVKGEHVAIGEVIEIDPPRSISYTWDWKDAPIGARTVLKFELTKDGSGTLVRLTHTGFPNLESAENHQHGWVYYLGRLKTVATGGDPGPDGPQC